VTDTANTGAALPTSYLAISDDGGISFFFTAPAAAGRVGVIAAMEAAAGAAYDEGSDVLDAVGGDAIEAAESAESAGWEVYEAALTDDTYTIWER